MTYQKLFRGNKSRLINRGSLLIELSIAITLGLVFIAIIINVTSSTKELFYYANEKDRKLSQGFVSESNPFDWSMCSPFISVNRVIGSYSYDFLKEGSINPIQSINKDNINIVPISLPIANGNLITDIEIRNNIVYVSTDSSVYSDPDIFVFDISNTDNPIMLSSINTGPGISGIEVNNNKIFASVSSSQNQIQKININNSLTLGNVSNFSLIAPFATATKPFATTIKSTDEYLFLGTEKWDGPEMYVFDIDNIDTSNPLFTFEVSSKVNNFLFYKNILSLTASAYEQMISFSLDEKNQWTKIGSFSPRGWSRQEGSVMYNFGNNTAFGRTSGGFDIKNDHELFLWNDYLENISVPQHSINIPSGVYGLIIDNDFVYASTGNSSGALTVTDLSLSSTTAIYVDLPLSGRVMKCYLDNIYILGNNSSTIYRIHFN